MPDPHATGPGASLVAIDGPAGSGKSTLARRLAHELRLPYVNTGTMYRVVTLEALRSGIDLDHGPELARLARRLRFDLDSTTDPPMLAADGVVPDEEEITAPDVERNVSLVASHPELRTLLRDEQRRLGAEGAVMEGRDIGTVVFPEARVKIFLVADPGERAARRVRERGQAGPVHPSESLAQDLAARDARDSTINPFVPAPDAVPIDTTGRTADEVFAHALAIVEGRIGPRERSGRSGPGG